MNPPLSVDEAEMTSTYEGFVELARYPVGYVDRATFTKLQAIPRLQPDVHVAELTAKPEAVNPIRFTYVYGLDTAWRLRVPPPTSVMVSEPSVFSRFRVVCELFIAPLFWKMIVFGPDGTGDGLMVAAVLRFVFPLML